MVEPMYLRLLSNLVFYSSKAFTSAQFVMPQLINSVHIVTYRMHEYAKRLRYQCPLGFGPFTIGQQ
jgi:hypothetical protein